MLQAKAEITPGQHQPGNGTWSANERKIRKYYRWLPVIGPSSAEVTTGLRPRGTSRCFHLRPLAFICGYRSFWHQGTSLTPSGREIVMLSGKWSESG
jgi:hypothetical protein